jgi:hypothetical protein
VPVSQDGTIVGSIGVLTIATRGPAGPGEVLLSIRGGSECYIAWSPGPLPLVIESRGTRAVEVSPWTDPVSSFPA